MSLMVVANMYAYTVRHESASVYGQLVTKTDSQDCVYCGVSVVMGCRMLVAC